ncbi:hypothetical protein H4S14_000779 [Agrobacterium vitis]|nr:hypothetical protein [Agrobacterium vitis]MBE1437052.1 hypothetical protein [Agrobacterium vitis]
MTDNTTAILSSLIARQTAMEVILTNFMVGMSRRLDTDSRLINQVMIASEDMLLAAKRKASPQDADIAAETLAYFQDYSARLIVAMTPKGTEN